jgi:hypothetical protein
VGGSLLDDDCIDGAFAADSAAPFFNGLLLGSSLGCHLYRLDIGHRILAPYFFYAGFELISDQLLQSVLLHTDGILSFQLPDLSYSAGRFGPSPKNPPCRDICRILYQQYLTDDPFSYPEY